MSDSLAHVSLGNRASSQPQMASFLTPFLSSLYRVFLAEASFAHLYVVQSAKLSRSALLMQIMLAEALSFYRPYPVWFLNLSSFVRPVYRRGC